MNAVLLALIAVKIGGKLIEAFGEFNFVYAASNKWLTVQIIVVKQIKMHFESICRLIYFYIM